MSNRFDRYNDGSDASPRLAVSHSISSLSKLPMNAATEWTLEEKLSRVKAAGFEAVQARLNEQGEVAIKPALDAAGLGLILAHSPRKLEDTRRLVEGAVRCGAQFVFAQPASAFHTLDEVAELVTQGRRIANDNGLAYFVEVHRNYFTENIPQTLQLIDRVPEIRFTADISHLVLVGEFYGWEAEGAAEKMMPILKRVSHAHGRISNGEQAQVDVGDGSGQTAQFFVSLWEIMMRHWQRGAGPGDVFPFSSELLPPRYAITLLDGSEFSDRWEQSLVMKRLAEQAWAQARAS